MSRTRLRIIFSVLLLLICNVCCGQNPLQKKNRDAEQATIKGRIVQHEKKDFQIDLNELQCMLNQQIQLPEPPVPKEQWPEMTQQQRQDWVKNFEASEQGKAFIADRKKRIEAAERFEIQVEDNGSFTLYDVPPGLYGLRGGVEKKIGDKNYVFEVFGQIDVAKDVEEVLLDPMAIAVTRLAKPNEAIPTVNIKTFDEKATIDNKLLKSRNVLVSFWSLNSPPSVEFSKAVQQSFKDVTKQMASQTSPSIAAKDVAPNFQLLSICVDCDRKKALKHIVDNGLAGWHGYAKDWEHETVSEFGVRSIPALFLLGADGKIKMTPFDFQFAMRSADAKLSQIIIDVLNGKNVPTRIATEPTNDQSDQKEAGSK